jgi:hypothetical protein
MQAGRSTPDRARAQDVNMGGESSDDSGDDAAEPDDEAGSDSRGTIEDLKEVMKMLETAEPQTPPGPQHGLELQEQPDEEVTIQETDKLAPVGRVTAVVDGIIVVKVRPRKQHAILPASTRVSRVPRHMQWLGSALQPGP